MKRTIALLLAVLMIGALLVACGNSKSSDESGSTTPEIVKTVVNKDYDDGYAKEYAKSVTTDDAGNTTYEFTGTKYESFVENHKNVVSNEIEDQVVEKHGKGFGQYAYVNVDEKAVFIGLNDGEYDESFAKEEAPIYAKSAFKVFQNLENPVSVIRVIYCKAGDQTSHYGEFEIDLSTLK